MSRNRASTLLHDPYAILRRPVLTEKSHRMLPGSQKEGQEGRARYTFEVHVKANKAQIRKAVEAAFGVTVEAVSTMVIKPRRKTFRMISGRGGLGYTRQRKRAVIRLAKGSKTIDLF